MRKNFYLAILLFLMGILAGCNLPRKSEPEPDLAATLAALGAGQTTSQPVSPTLENSSGPGLQVTPGAVPTPLGPGTGSVPTGKIAYTCQVFGIRYRDQICIINADGSGYQRITTDDNAAHFYPSVAPEGNSVLYSAKLTEKYEIYETDLSGNTKRLTYNLGTLTGPEASPDGKWIAFTLGDDVQNSIWLMERDGSNPRQLYKPGWDATWSPDGTQILFASTDKNNSIQLFVINLDGSGLRQVTQMPDLRGRSDWSADGQHMVTYSGKPWGREIFMFAPDGANPVQITPPGGNSQGPSFSPDGQWVAFTAYFDHIGEDNACEIYIVKIDGTQLTRLTNNAYCDWQPRWGP